MESPNYRQHNLETPVGIKIPGDDELKDSVWKTAHYVARNGHQFEEKLHGDRFSFLQEDDEYNDYYRFLVSSFEATNNKGKQDMAEDDYQGEVEREEALPLDSIPQNPYLFVFSTYDKNVSQMSLKIMKTTALYCIANEENEYLNLLRERYREEEIFAFLKPDHPLNPVFTGFINQYKQIISREFGPLTDLGKDFKLTLMRRCFKRAEYEEYALAMKEEQRQVYEKFKLKFSAYDWSSFKIIGKIAFSEEDQTKKLPEPLDFVSLSFKSLQKQTPDAFLTSNIEISSQTENNSNGHDDTTKAKLKKKPKMKIKAAGETRLKRDAFEASSKTENSKFIECPITHKMIPEHKFDKHIQILLSDPNYLKEREQFKAKHKLTNLTYEGVHENIKRLAKINTDHNNKEQSSKRQKT